jgi:WD40 repeat protein
VETIALSPDSKKVASGYRDGTVALWNIDTGKVIKTWTGHTGWVDSVSWSPDGGRVLSGSDGGTFRVWDVESGKTILGPINTGREVLAVCYSPDAKMIATSGIANGLTIRDANTGESLKIFEGGFPWLAWTSDRKSTQPRGLNLTCAKTTSVRFQYLPVSAYHTPARQRNYGTSTPINPSEHHFTIKNT